MSVGGCKYGGYAGELLRVDLTTGRIEREETARYLPDWIGGRGMAIRIAWDEIPPGMTYFQLGMDRAELERAARVSEEYIEKFTNGKVKGKTGSLTALPIVETQAGDISAFVPTNVISITDGQIFLEDSLFKSGLKPAMDPGISVSRVGGAAQVPIIKKLGAGIKTSLAQYRELEAFAQFASDLDEVSKAQLEHGMRVTELTKQAENSPMSVAEMGIVLYSVNEGYLKEVEVEKVKDFEKSLLSFMSSEYGDLMKSITISGDYNEEIENAFKEVEKLVKFSPRDAGTSARAGQAEEH